MNNLIEWCEDLDYEKYVDNWGKIATSAYNDIKPDIAFDEEMFMKENEDYERRLKEHLYLFEDTKIEDENMMGDDDIINDMGEDPNHSEGPLSVTN